MVKVVPVPRERRISQPGRVVLASWAYGRVGDTLVLCTEGSGDAREEDVEGWLARLAVPDFTKILTYTHGAAPSAKHRSRIATFWETSGRPIPPVAIVTDSTVARAVMKAMEWLVRSMQIRAFPPHDIAGALAWLEADAPLAHVTEAITVLSAALRANNERSVAQRIPKPDD